MRWNLSQYLNLLLSVNLHERYLSYPLGLAWWAEAGLKIVALSMFMAAAVFAIIACLTARFSCGTLKTGCSPRAYAPQLEARGSPIAVSTEVPGLLRGLSSWEELLTRAPSKA